MEDGKLKEYLGNYTYYKEQKDKEAARQAESKEDKWPSEDIKADKATRGESRKPGGIGGDKGARGERGKSGDVRSDKGKRPEMAKNRRDGERAKGRR